MAAMSMVIAGVLVLVALRRCWRKGPPAGGQQRRRRAPPDSSDGGSASGDSDAVSATYG